MKKEKGVFVTNKQVRLTGSANVARFLAQCLYWSNIEMVQQRQGWFYKSRTEWQAETWLSRYQQEKARTQLRDMGLLEEKRERMNTGIRLWFRLNTALYYALLNNLAEQSEITQTENNSAALYESTLSEQSETVVTDCSYSYENLTDSKYSFNNKTIVPDLGLNEPFKPENSTMVSGNNTIKTTISSDNHCINNNDVESIDIVEVDESVEADASPLSGDLTDCSENNKHRIDPESFLFCHPFIYQFIRYCHNSASDDFLETLVDFGFAHFDVQEALVRYVERHGHAILEYYRQSSPIALKPLTRTDIDDAVRASLEV